MCLSLLLGVIFFFLKEQGLKTGHEKEDGCVSKIKSWDKRQSSATENDSNNFRM